MNPKIVLPFGLLAVGFTAAVGLVTCSPAAERRPEESMAPLVRAEAVAPQAVQLQVTAYGTVVPRTESELVAQVAGEVVWVSPSLVAGGFFAEGEELLRIEATDYELALESTRAAVARTSSETNRARKERDRQQRLADQSVASQARIDDAESAYRQAQASWREAKAALARAERDLERCTLRASFDGRVRQERVDAGQFVNRGDRIGVLYAVDYAEVRLPVPDRELSFLDLSLAYPSEEAAPATDAARPEVILRADFAGQANTWRGQIVRTEGELDPKSRMVHVVARVADPYGRERSRPAPLAVGLFVEAEILGRRLDQAYVVPRTALYPNEQVAVIDGESRLRFRDVEVVRVRREDAVLGPDSLRPGERICTSPLAAPVEGMRVRVLGDERPAEVAVDPEAEVQPELAEEAS